MFEDIYVNIKKKRCLFISVGHGKNIMMPSTALILIAHQSQPQTKNNFRAIVYRHFDDIDVNQVWLDPFEDKRAVALVDFQNNQNGKMKCMPFVFISSTKQF